MLQHFPLPLQKINLILGCGLALLGSGQLALAEEAFEEQVDPQDKTERALNHSLMFSALGAHQIEQSRKKLEPENHKYIINISPRKEDSQKKRDEGRISPAILKKLCYVIDPELKLTCLDEILIWDPVQGLPPWSWWIPFFKTGEGRELESTYKTWRQQVNGHSKNNRIPQTESILQAFEKILLSHINKYAKYKVSLTKTLRHDSNVTQSPDEQVLVSDKAGQSSYIEAKLQYTPLAKRHWDPKAHLSIGGTLYHDNDFKTRENRFVEIAFSGVHHRCPWNWLKQWSPSLSHRIDELDNGTGMGRGFSTSSVGLQWLAKPKNSSLKRFSDHWLHLGKVQTSFMQYHSSFSQDSTGANRDGMTPSIFLMALSLKKWREGILNTNISGLLRSTTSDSEQQNYDKFNLKLGQIYRWGDHSLEGSTTADWRWQKNYQGRPRRDDAYEMRAKYKWQWQSEVEIYGQISYRKQNSNQSSFSYDNSSALLGMNYHFKPQ